MNIIFVNGSCLYFLTNTILKTYPRSVHVFGGLIMVDRIEQNGDEKRREKLRKRIAKTLAKINEGVGDPRSASGIGVLIAALLGFLIGGPAGAAAAGFACAALIHGAGGWMPAPQVPLQGREFLASHAEQDVEQALDADEVVRSPRAAAALIRRIARCRAHGTREPSNTALPVEYWEWLDQLGHDELRLVARLPSRQLFAHLSGGRKIENVMAFGDREGMAVKEDSSNIIRLRKAHRSALQANRFLFQAAQFS